MNDDDDYPLIKGRPTKSASEIRSRLESIHKANAPRSSGPIGKGANYLKTIAVRTVAWSIVPRISLRADHENGHRNYYCRLLLDSSSVVGAITGGMLGANFGFAAPVIFGWAPLDMAMPFFGLLAGSLIGIVVARSFVVYRRIDLFGSGSRMLSR